MKRSLKDIYFLVRYSHFQDDLLIYSELLIYTYHLRMCWKNMGNSFLDLKRWRQQCGNWLAGNKDFRVLLLFFMVTTTLLMSCQPAQLHSSLSFVSLDISPTPLSPLTPTPRTIHAASLNHNYIFKIRLEGKCFFCEIFCFQQGRRVHLLLDWIFSINSLRESYPEWVEWSPQEQMFCAVCAWWLMELFVYPCCQKTPHKLRKAAQASICLPFHNFKGDYLDLWKLGIPTLLETGHISE